MKVKGEKEGGGISRTAGTMSRTYLGFVAPADCNDNVGPKGIDLQGGGGADSG